MDELVLIPPTVMYADRIREYAEEFPSDRLQVTLDPDRIPGTDGLENCATVEDWLRYVKEQEGKISWYMAVRRSDGRIVGFSCLRHALEFDDDDPEFASHTGYSVRPSEQRKGYGSEQLRLLLEKAREAGLVRVRIICRDSNAGSNRVIRANGGIFVDSIYGEESGMTLNRYDIPLTDLYGYRYLTLRDRPELMERAAEWFSSKWGVPEEAYLECMRDYLEKKTELGWYLCMDGEKIVGGMGVIENDFHDRKDLTPNVCAVYTEEPYRNKGIAGRLLNMTVEDLRTRDISPLYLLTDHTGFYERYGWRFLCMAQGDGEPEMSRMYIHE